MDTVVNKFKVFSYAGIVSILFSLVLGVFEVFLLDISFSLVNLFYILTVIILIASSILYLMGFYFIGSSKKDYTLSKTTLLYLSMRTLIGILLLVSVVYAIDNFSMLSLFVILIFGSATILFGYNLRRSKVSPKNLVKTMGLLYIISGALYVSVLFAGFAIIFSLIADTYGVRILFKQK